VVVSSGSGSGVERGAALGRVERCAAWDMGSAKGAHTTPAHPAVKIAILLAAAAAVWRRQLLATGGHP